MKPNKTKSLCNQRVTKEYSVKDVAIVVIFAFAGFISVNYIADFWFIKDERLYYTYPPPNPSSAQATGIIDNYLLQNIQLFQPTKRPSFFTFVGNPSWNQTKQYNIDNNNANVNTNTNTNTNNNNNNNINIPTIVNSSDTNDRYNICMFIFGTTKTSDYYRELIAAHDTWASPKDPNNNDIFFVFEANDKLPIYTNNNDSTFFDNVCDKSNNYRNCIFLSNNNDIYLSPNNLVAEQHHGGQNPLKKKILDWLLYLHNTSNKYHSNLKNQCSFLMKIDSDAYIVAPKMRRYFGCLNGFSNYTKYFINHTIDTNNNNDNKNNNNIASNKIANKNYFSQPMIIGPRWNHVPHLGKSTNFPLGYAMAISNSLFQLMFDKTVNYTFKQNSTIFDDCYQWYFKPKYNKKLQKYVPNSRYGGPDDVGFAHCLLTIHKLDRKKIIFPTESFYTARSRRGDYWSFENIINSRSAWEIGMSAFHCMPSYNDTIKFHNWYQNEKLNKSSPFYDKINEIFRFSSKYVKTWYSDVKTANLNTRPLYEIANGICRDEFRKDLINKFNNDYPNRF